MIQLAEIVRFIIRIESKKGTYRIISKSDSTLQNYLYVPFSFLKSDPVRINYSLSSLL